MGSFLIEHMEDRHPLLYYELLIQCIVIMYSVIIGTELNINTPLRGMLKRHKSSSCKQMQSHIISLTMIRIHY